MPSCELHRYHFPKPIGDETHHIIPQAWQLAWTPEGLKAGKLWDPRVAELCPTGHSNVHSWLVTYMKDLALRRETGRPRSREQKMAYLAITRFTEVGGDLELLWERGLWGRGFRYVRSS